MRWFNIQPKRNALQREALKKALSIYNSNPDEYKDTMFCPYCGQPLIKSGNRRNFETLTEHVSCSKVTPKDEYICSANTLFDGRYLFKGDPESQLGCKFGILHSWNGGLEVGNSYISNFHKKLIEMSRQSIINKIVIDQYIHEDYENKFNAALNTFACQMEVSIEKVGLLNKIYIPAWLTFNIIQLTLDFSYQADNFGIVHKTFVNLGFLEKDKYSNNGFSIVGQWPLHTFKYLLRSFNRRRKQAIKFKDMDMLKKCYEPSINKKWVYRLFNWYIRHIHFIEYRKLLNDISSCDKKC